MGVGAFPPGSVTLNGAPGRSPHDPPVAGSDATNIMNNPAGFYYNAYAAANATGVMRGQLVRTQ